MTALLKDFWKWLWPEYQSLYERWPEVEALTGHPWKIPGRKAVEK